MEKKLVVGGQAVIEGVLMRTKNYSVIAVRRPDNKIGIISERLEMKRAADLFFLRGIVMLVESLRLGVKALNRSANEALGEEGELGKREMVFAFLLAAVFAAAIFIAIPFFAAAFLTKDRGIFFNLVDGLIRLAFFLGYLFLVSKIPDIRRVFQYHGAEHKTVHAYEHGRKLEVSEVKRYSPLHPRCGTNFMLIVVVLSILLFSLITGPLWLRFGSRILLIPVLAGIAYEILKLISKFEKNSIIRMIAYPGLMLQKFTTREPDESQIEVAIAALKKALELEEAHSPLGEASSK